jgi:hypothetical protein
MSFLKRLRTFPRGLWWVGFFSFCCTCVLGALTVTLTGAWCTALAHYELTTIRDLLFRFFMLVVYAPAILWLGIKGYRALRSRRPALRSIHGTIGYCAALAVITFPLHFALIPMNLWNHGQEPSICSKSTSDGMFTTSTGLTPKEYAHLQDMLPLLPELPITPDSINLFYYSDGFLPDFSLKVRCAVRSASVGTFPPYAHIAKDGPSGWMLDTSSKDPMVAWLVYEDGES